jgi:pyruvate carboxylase subunit B
LAVNPQIIQSPLPGGALTANTQMLRDNNLMSKYPEVVAAMKEVVEKGGFGTSVTPVSQFYFQQAFNNVMFGKWKKIAEGYGKMVLGYFGKTPCEPDSEIVKIASEQLELQPTTETVVDLNDKDPNKGLAVAQKRLEEAGLPVNDENLFISAACKEKGILFLQGKGTIGVRKNEAKASESVSSDSSSNGYTVTVNGKKYAVALEGGKATVNGKLYDFSVKDGIEAKSAGSGEGTPVKAALPGNVLKVLVSEGDSIAEGDVIAVVEAMKMETEIKSPVSGTVKSVEIEVGNKVQTGQVLVTVG